MIRISIWSYTRECPSDIDSFVEAGMNMNIQGDVVLSQLIILR